MSTPEKALALVLRVIDFSETSVVLTLLTREFGKVRGLAKGARRPKGPFESALDLLALCRIVFLRKSSDALDLVTEAKLERRFRAGGRNLSCLYAGYYVAELLNDLTDDGDPHPELFDAATGTLAALETEDDVARLVLRFELTALRLLGHLPSLENCVECGTPLPPAPRVAFGQLAGGVLCVNCRVGKRALVSVSAGVIEAMSKLADPTSDEWQTIDFGAHRGELRAVLNKYLWNLLGHKPRMADYLGILN